MRSKTPFQGTPFVKVHRTLDEPEQAGKKDTHHVLIEQDLMKSINHELHDRSIRAKMNPHFIFNSLSSIQSLIYSGNVDDAVHYLSRFSTLLRKVLDNADKSLITVTEEIDTLRMYIELEALRFSGTFTFRINALEGLDHIEIPTMVIQPFVENAIVHGLCPKLTGHRHLDLNFYSAFDDGAVCEILDNGIGREQSAKLKDSRNAQHVSKGIGFARQRLELFARTYERPTSLDIQDLRNETGEPCGTKVSIRF